MTYRYCNVLDEHLSSYFQVLYIDLVEENTASGCKLYNGLCKSLSIVNSSEVHNHNFRSSITIVDQNRVQPWKVKFKMVQIL